MAEPKPKIKLWWGYEIEPGEATEPGEGTTLTLDAEDLEALADHYLYEHESTTLERTWNSCAYGSWETGQRMRWMAKIDALEVVLGEAKIQESIKSAHDRLRKEVGDETWRFLTTGSVKEVNDYTHGWVCGGCPVCCDDCRRLGTHGVRTEDGRCGGCLLRETDAIAASRDAASRDAAS